jgi:hypothetical protein
MVLTFFLSPPTLGRGINKDVATSGTITMRYTMANLRTNISNTVDRRRPHSALVDGGSLPIWIVLHH